MIWLEPVGPDNWRLGLKVSEAQQRFVSSDMRLLARAYAYREHGSRAFVVLDGEIPVGMAMYHDCAELGAYDFSQLFIDARYQGQGFGRRAAQLVLEQMEAEGRFDKVVLCYIEGNDAARKLYSGLGFTHTGQQDEDEIIMERTIR